ncbi:GTPase IMAP family member 7-like isoform X3 [Sparus aurata]|uniref:GTPase IMAP family member 7-like isoform X3 n=1 Tax=Sparus aurata TaxID=8175 RepID=UPI0011C0CB24|nr:GTPase IMAP family member 7-like isoform X3 [Sparus aurata]
MADVSNTKRIAIVGKTGAGKSSLANTIFAEAKFKIYHTFSSGTKKCQSETRSVNGRSITLIDTPGLFDTDRSEEEIRSEILRCITECAPGLHAFLVLLKVEKYTEQEQAVIKKIQEYFSEEAFKYATVLFTHADQLPEKQTIEEFAHQNKRVSDLVKKCGGRCHIIDNKYWKEKPKNEYRSNQFQVEELLKTIDKMVMENKGGCFTNGTLQKVEEMKKQDVEKIRQSQANLTEEEIREEANDRVYNILNRLRGIRTVDFMGALFGVAVMVAAVITALQA